MKKILCMVFAAVLALSMFACDHAYGQNDPETEIVLESESLSESEDRDIEDIIYTHYFGADWQVYKDADALIDAADVVFIGRVYDISFDALNAVTEGAPRYELYTAYSIEPECVYKGEMPSAYDRLYVQGGIRGYKTDEQLRVLKNRGLSDENAAIPIYFEEYGKLGIGMEIGKTYLFVVSQSENERYFIMLNPAQTFFSLDDPHINNTVNGISISAKDIVSEFGQDKWETLNNNWKNNAYAPIKYPTDEEYIAAADPIFKESFGFEDTSLFEKSVIVMVEEAKVIYTFTVCGVTTSEYYSIILSNDLDLIRASGRSGDKISSFMSDAFVARAEEAKQKVIEDSREYGEPHFSIGFAEGYLYIGAEFIIDIDPEVEEAPCGDHKHVFIKQNICDTDGNIVNGDN